MIHLSKFPVNTLKSQPKVSDNRSTSLLLQAWMIRQEMAGVYNYLPLGFKVLQKIENIVREEMNNSWAFELLMPALGSKEHWVQTGRWDAIDVLFKVPASGGKEYALNPTQEDIVTPLMKEFIQSYKDLEFGVYHIQHKFRNEVRAKSGLLRGREFLMKDLYSFHTSEDTFQVYYDNMKEVYTRVFERLWLGNDTYMTLASWGDFTDKNSHEFQTVLDIGEDIIYIDKRTGIAYNQEITPSKVWNVFNNTNEPEWERTDVEWKWLIWVKALSEFLNIEIERTTKTMLFETDGWDVVAVAVRWDYNINELKLKKVLDCKEVSLLKEEKVKEITWAEVWYAGVLWLPKHVRIIWDDSCENRKNFESWANKTDYHSININFWRDVDMPSEFYDIKDAKPWDIHPDTWSVYEVHKASEVGNIFPLSTKFPDACGMTYADADGKEKPVFMWSYGIGISRVMWVMAEYFMDETGISWPENVAPATHYIIVLWEDNIEKASELAKKIESKGWDVILDDRMGRKDWFGQKMWDAELLWVPNIIVLSPKTLEKGWYEMRKRWEKEWTIVQL